MKSLRQSLIDYELPLLNAVAARRNLNLEAANKQEVMGQLADALLSPAATAIIQSDLSREENEALQFLLSRGGKIERARFTRQFGAIRPMGSARMARERPWENPVNPAEGLWYCGFIYKAFQVTAQGGQEIIYIPTDILPLLAVNVPVTEPQSPAFQVEPVAAPEQIFSGRDRLRENFFSLLVYLQTHPVRLKNQGAISAGDKQSLTNCLLPSFILPFTTGAELEFLLHLGQRAQLLSIIHGCLRPNRELVRNWLQADETQQVWLLQNTWRADPTWNDLWHVPGLNPQPTGWENSPLRARSKILGYLEKIDVPAGQWLSLDSFVSRIKQIDPDFQRADGNYQNWYIQDQQGNSLMGFEHWDQVEGGLIRHILTHILPLLGVVETGGLADTGTPTGFRITVLGQGFLSGQQPRPQRQQKTVFLHINNRFQVRVPAQASLYDRFQLARIAELEHRENGRAMYHITRAGISRALKNGVTPDQITAFLTRATNNQIPLKVIETLRAWGTRFGTARLEQATLLRVKSGNLVSELRQHPELRPLLGEVIGPTAILVPANNSAKVRKILTELGYLEAKK